VLFAGFTDESHLGLDQEAGAAVAESGNEVPPGGHVEHEAKVAARYVFPRRASFEGLG